MLAEEGADRGVRRAAGEAGGLDVLPILRESRLYGTEGGEDWDGGLADEPENDLDRVRVTGSTPRNGEDDWRKGDPNRACTLRTFCLQTSG